MADPGVRIVNLEPMLAASFYGFGESPEGIAIPKMEKWAGPRGLLGHLDEHPTFGFNNPNPSGNSTYGYEIWIRVDERYEPEGDMRLIEFMGGAYAVGLWPCVAHLRRQHLS